MRRINSFIRALDNNISSKESLISIYQGLMLEIFDSWFIRFDPVLDSVNGTNFSRVKNEVLDFFPDDFVKNEHERIPKNWSIKSLGDVCKILDRERIPLSKAERQKKQGIYPYYGAGGIIDYLDKYIFDGEYILIAEDGNTVRNRQGNPTLNFVWGKIWVNNHAHIIQGVDGVSNEFLWCLLSKVKIDPYITGAAQPKLNQKNLKSIPVLMPDDDVMKKFNLLSSSIFSLVKSLSEEVILLNELHARVVSKLVFGDNRSVLESYEELIQI